MMKSACIMLHRTNHTAPAHHVLPPPLLHTLYRKTLRVLAHVERCQAHTIAEQRWAEFIPSSSSSALSALPRPCACAADMRQLARCCFEQPGTRASVQDAFEFIKESNSSLPLLEALAAWDAHMRNGSCELIESLSLLSAALVHHRESVSTWTAKSSSLSSSSCGSWSVTAAQRVPASYSLLHRERDVYRRYVTQLVTDLVQQARQTMSASGASLDALSTTDMNALLNALRARAALQRRDTHVEDFSLVNALGEGVCAEYVLNLILHTVLAELGFDTGLVGVDLVFRWVRVTRPRRPGPPIFVSWSHGAYDRAGVERRIRTADTRWFRATAHDASQRCGIVCALLRKQLSCVPVVHMTELDKRHKSLCTELLLHTLSLSR